ncbi:hypothetical protein LINGRAPRIM_LOCUS2201, partial [Linum grandiflorum]
REVRKQQAVQLTKERKRRRKQSCLGYEPQEPAQTRESLFIYKSLSSTSLLPPFHYLSFSPSFSSTLGRSQLNNGFRHKCRRLHSIPLHLFSQAEPPEDLCAQFCLIWKIDSFSKSATRPSSLLRGQARDGRESGCHSEEAAGTVRRYCHQWRLQVFCTRS